MKKSKYITKYDYLAYYSTKHCFLFYTNAEIFSAINAQIELANGDSFIPDHEDDDFNYDKEHDAYLLYKQYKLDSDVVISDSFNKNDHYINLFLKHLEQLKDVDENNPLIMEGRRIDIESKEFIAHKFNNLKEFTIYDFDEHKSSIEQQAIKTQELIELNEKLILFQPVFLDSKKLIVTKCDALVKDGTEINIIETKGTTTSKINHFLDIYYQYKLISNIPYMSKFEVLYKLCLIKYCLANVSDPLEFIISESCNLSKSVSVKRELPIDEKQNRKLGIKFEKNIDVTFDINSCLTLDDFNAWLQEVNSKKFEKYINLYEEFDHVIEKLWEIKKSLNNSDFITSDIHLSYDDMPEFLNNPFKNELKTLYSLKNSFFKYSGNSLRLTNQNIDSFIKKGYWNSINNYEMLEFEHSNNFSIFKKHPYIYDYDKFQSLLNQLKDKCVYFDFETINTGFRVVDNSLPFMQIVTQVSVIKKHNLDYKNLECQNLMIDPLKIDNNWFKQIVDSLYSGNDYSYVVYNKSFEVTRLKEIQEFINEEKYTEMINVIISNIYDIADFFDIRKKIVIHPDLYGYYSIKKVLPLIEKNAKHIFEQVNCLDYKSLEISNGLICQNKTKGRFFGLVDDNEWNHVVSESKKYCENDVRAMIAVELFIKEYISKLENKDE